MELSITNYLDTKYKEFAIDVVENRAIPSLIDGFKPTERKIIYSALTLKRDEFFKIFQLAGIVASYAKYSHGDSPLNKTIITMAKPYKNSISYFDREGQFGSLRDPEAGAPRYIGVKLNNVFDTLFKDIDLTTNRIQEGHKVEPYLYYPILPTILLNGQQGIAVGHGSNIFNREPNELCDSIIQLVKTGKWKEPTVNINGYRGKIEFLDGRWHYNGVIEQVNTSTLKITELPPSYDIEYYIEHLNSLIEKKIITGYDNNSSEYPEFTISIPRQTLKDLIAKEKLISTFKLVETNKENLTVLDENFKIKTFTSIKDLCEYFINYRLSIYTKRKESRVKTLSEDILFNEQVYKFITLYISGKIKIRNRTIQEVEESIANNKLIKIDDSYSYLTSIPLRKLTKEELEKLNNKLKELKESLEFYKVVQEKELYLSDLTELKKQLKQYA